MSAPRIVVPGVVDVVLLDGGEAVVERGPACDVPYAEPRDLREDAWFVQARGPIPGLDLSRYPQVQARLQLVRWVRVREPGPGPALHISRRERTAKLTFRDDSGERTFGATDEALWAAILGPPGEDLSAWERARATATPAWDRVVRALTGGVLSMRDVELANWAAALTADKLDIEERVLAEVAARAAGQRELARALVESLEKAGEADERCAAPPYGDAVCTRLPAVTLRPGGAFTGETLRLEPETVWRVYGVEDWEPPSAAERRRQSFARWQQKIQEARAKGRRQELLAWGGLAAALALALSVFLIWRAFSGG